MQFTKKLIKEIKGSIKSICGAARDVEIADRAMLDSENDTTLNFLLWDEDSDLDNLVAIDDAGDVLELDGHVALDCYCYFKTGGMDRNCYILIGPGGVIAYASDDDRNHVDQIAKIMGKAVSS